MAEPLNATFFTLKHRDRAVLLPATLAMIAVLGLIIAAWAGLNWRALALMFEVFANFPADPDENQAIALFTGMMGMFASTMLLLVPFYIALASYEAACLRWMIRGEAPGFFGLTLDHDTWRVYGIYWCWFVTHLAIGTVISILMFPLMFMFMGDIAAQGPNPDPAAVWEMQLKMQSVSLLQYIPLAFIGIRLGPAAATSIARRRFSFFEAWTVTSDRFLALLGSWAVLWLLFGLAYVLWFGATYGQLVGDLIPRMFADWPNPPLDAWQELPARIFSARGLTLIAAAYGGALVLWIAYQMMSFGVNARVAMVALEEGKITQAPPDADAS